MPLYEYECGACKRRFEIIRKMSDPPVETCPTCGGAVQKLQSAPAFQFKGSGWYVTDYARKDQPGGSRAEGESKEGGKDGSKDGSKDGGKEAVKDAKAAENREKASDTKTTTTPESSSSTSAPAGSSTTKNS